LQIRGTILQFKDINNQTPATIRQISTSTAYDCELLKALAASKQLCCCNEILQFLTGGDGYHRWPV